MNKLKVIKNFLTIFLLVIIMTGCSDYKAVIGSNTTWSASFNGKTVNGTGSRTIDLSNDDKVCCTVQKKSAEGYLKLTIIDDSFLGIEGESKETTAEYGVITVCNE